MSSYDQHRKDEAATQSAQNPAHYTRMVIEPLTFIEANKLPFDIGNIIKYVCRYDAKNGREDIVKAQRYLGALLERLDREARIEAGEDARNVWSAPI